MSAARRSLGVDLRRLSVPATVADDAVLILSELVSNALKHARPLAGGTIRVAWWMEDDRILRIAVTDGGRHPRPAAAVRTTAHQRLEGGLEVAELDEVDESAVDGRGLGIVGVLADAWGVEPFAADPGQPPRPDDPAAPKTVWASVRLNARPAAPTPPDKPRPGRPGRPRRIAGVRAALTGLPRGAGQRIGKVFGKGVGKGLGKGLGNGIGGSGEAKGSAAAVAL